MKTIVKIFIKTPSLHLTIFLISMIASGFALFMVDESYSDLSLMNIRIIIGITLLLGLLSIYMLTANKEQKIVYLRKEEQKEEEMNKVELNELSQLQWNEIEKTFGDTQHSLQEVLTEVCNQLQAGQGAIYIAKSQTLELKYSYAMTTSKENKIIYDFGEGLVGRVAAERKLLYIDKLPKGYMTIFSGLGAASPSYLVIVPIANKESVKGVMEISTFHPINKVTLDQLQEVATFLADAIQKINK